MSRRVGLAAVIAATLGVAAAPNALGTYDATPQLLEVTMVGTYSEIRETITTAPAGTGSLHEVVDLRWQARTAVAAPLVPSGPRGAITARLTGSVSLYRRVRSELTRVGGVGCVRVESGAADRSRPAPRLTLDLNGVVTAADGNRLRVSPSSLPVVVRGSQRCATLVPDAPRSAAVALRPLLLPTRTRLGGLLAVPRTAVRRGRPFGVERSVVLETPGPAGSGTRLIQRWSLNLLFSCVTAGC